MNLYDELKKRFLEKADPETAVHMAAYMRDQFPFYGIKSAPRRECCRPLLREAKKTPGLDWPLLRECWADEHREFQYFVADYLKAKERELTYDDVLRMEPFFRTKQWWDTIDALDTTAGSVAFRDDRIDALMLKWSEDPDFWLRRAAIDHQRKRKDKTNTELLKAILLNNLGSSEFFINKAIGWSLREYSKTDPEWVRAFLADWGSRMAPLSVREASKYL
ncbi:MAG: DNA alkylation repair protein [Anaerovoracaceae bacterium]|jgi:3-methyladenine DNA glycosylase AlkD